MLFKFKTQLGLFSLTVLTISCSEIESIGTEPSHANIITIGGIETDAMAIETRANAVDAETQTWLVQPLESGLDITYGLYGVSHGESQEDVAILKLTDKKTKPATYSFNYRMDGTKHTTDNEKAIWHNNGYHYFQGVHVPGRIRYTTSETEVDGGTSGTAPGLTTDQHNYNAIGTDAQLGNYILLSHYLGMPANYRLTATVERIKLPFRHRLARVIAFVLIDPELNTTLKGYKKKVGELYETETDPTNVSIRFCNVRVLEGVKDVAGTDGHHTLTPKWGRPRKVIPHFDGEKGSYSYKTGTILDDNFKMYVGTSEAGKAEELYPTSNNWKAYHDDTGHKGFKEIDYGKVPVYDLIVRPTYSSWENVMYDEEGYDPDNESKLKELANVSNSIDFEIELENGLRYEKTFEFDLNANYQTVVYLRISREKVDYDDAGSEIWIEEKNYDGWYGTDNENGNTLSFAGSSWQRAYTYGAELSENHEDLNSSGGVTDGHFYNASSSEDEREKAQYFTSDYKSIWVEKFLQAYQGGKHHGDYFVLQSDISIDARLIPQDFVFTGHLDGQDNTISLTNVGDPVYKAAESLEGLYTETSGNYTPWIIPALYVKHVTPAVYYQASELTEVKGKTYVTETLTHHPEVQEVSHSATEEDVTNGNAEKVGDKVVDIEHQDEYYEVKEGESIEATAGETEKTPEIITYPEATTETFPAYPTTMEQLKTNEYYSDDNTGTRFTCPDLFQFSHNSQAYLFSGLKGDYTTAQESNPSLPAKEWEANVHKETNKSTIWVPTAGYRAEVLNVKVAKGYSLFKDNPMPYTGNVQNCYNLTAEGKDVVTNTPNIPEYK